MNARGQPQRPDIWLDESGRHENGVFFLASVGDAYAGSLGKRAGTVVLPGRIVPVEDLGWVELLKFVEDDNAVYRCSNSPSHTNQLLYRNCEGERFGRRWSDFIWDSTLDQILISTSLSERLKCTNLKGWRLDPVQVRSHFTGETSWEFVNLQCVGRNCQRKWTVAKGRNVCPNCGKQWIQCETCGMLVFYCLACERRACVPAPIHEGVGDRRLSREEVIPEREILEGSRWDGADFIGAYPNRYFSARVIGWLQSIHAGPIAATPVRFCTDDMSEQQKEWLATAGDWTTVTET